MVDSAVNLSIGTELDLSGLERDLAALKNQDFKFDVDVSAISKSFGQAQKHMQLSPKVDLTELHELNKLLDVKLAHFKQVQRHFDSNPLRVNVDKSAENFVTAFSQIKSGTITVKQERDASADLFFTTAGTIVGNVVSTEISKRLEQGIKFDLSSLFGKQDPQLQVLKQIEKNTKKDGLIGGTLKSFQSGVSFYTSQRFAEGFFKQVDGALEKTIGETTAKTGEKVGIAAVKAATISAGALSKAVLNRDLEDLTEKIKVAKKEIAEYIDPDEVKAAEKDLIESLANLIQKGTGLKAKEEAPAAFQEVVASIKAQRKPLSNAIQARQDARIVEAVDLAKEIASQLDFSNLEMGDVVITIGGFAGAKGTSSEAVAKKTAEAINAQTIASPNTFTDLPVATGENPLVWALAAAGRMAEMKILEPVNPDAVNAAAKAMAVKRDKPDANVNVLGYSAGGFVAEQTLDILGAAGLGNITGTSVATPVNVGLRPNLPEGQFNPYFGESDPLKYLVKPLEAVGLAMKSADANMQFPGVNSHGFDSYIAQAGIQESVMRRNAQNPTQRQYMQRQPQAAAKTEAANAKPDLMEKAIADLSESLVAAQQSIGQLTDNFEGLANSATVVDSELLAIGDSGQSVTSTLNSIAEAIEVAESAFKSVNDSFNVEIDWQGLGADVAALSTQFKETKAQLGEGLPDYSPTTTQLEVFQTNLAAIAVQLETLDVLYKKQIAAAKAEKTEPQEPIQVDIEPVQRSIVAMGAELTRLTESFETNIASLEHFDAGAEATSESVLLLGERLNALSATIQAIAESAKPDVNLVNLQTSLDELAAKFVTTIQTLQDLQSGLETEKTVTTLNLFENNLRLLSNELMIVRQSLRQEEAQPDLTPAFELPPIQVAPAVNVDTSFVTQIQDAIKVVSTSLLALSDSIQAGTASFEQIQGIDAAINDLLSRLSAVGVPDFGGTQESIADFIQGLTNVSKKLNDLGLLYVRQEQQLQDLVNIPIQFPQQDLQLEAIPAVSPVEEIAQTIQEELSAVPVADIVQSAGDSLATAIEDVATEVSTATAATEEALTQVANDLKGLADLNIAAPIEEFKASLSQNLLLDASKKRKQGEYQPDLRMLGKQMGVPTKNPETGKAFRKEELIDYLTSQFSPEQLQEAMGKIQLKLPDIDPSALEDLARWYEQISSQINNIETQPLEEQKRIIEEMQAAMLKVVKVFEFFEKSFTLGDQSNKVLQGRKSSFDQLWRTTEKIKQSWATTQKSVEQNIKDLEATSGDLGYKIQKNLSEGSPGITVEIRKNWEKTVGFVRKKIEELTKRAIAQGQALEQGVSFGADPAQLKVLSEAYQTTLQQLNDLKDGFAELQSFGADFGNFDEMIGRMSQTQIELNFAELTQDAELFTEALQQIQEALGLIESSAGSASNAVNQMGEESEAKTLRQTLDDIALQITGIADISQKSGEEIFEAFKENFRTEEIVQAFDGLQAAVQSSLAQVFAGDAVAGELARFIQGLSGQVAAGLINLTAVVAQRLGGVIVAVKESIMSAFGLLNDFVSDLQNNLMALGRFLIGAFVLDKLVRGMIAIGQQAFAAARQVDGLERSLDFSTADGGAETLEKIRLQAERLSISFQGAAEAYSQFSAATMGTSLEKQTSRIFENVATGIAARGLSNENQDRVFLALSQIASKGRVSLEELSGQLGEALPGALQVTARALGKTSAELIQMVENGQLLNDEFLTKFSQQLALESKSSVAASANTATAQLTRFENKLNEVKSALGQGLLSTFKAVFPVVNQSLEFLQNNLGAITTIVLTLTATLAASLAKAIIVVASELKLANLAMSIFGFNAELAAATIQSSDNSLRGWNTTVTTTTAATTTATAATSKFVTGLKTAGMAVKGMIGLMLPGLIVFSLFNTIGSFFAESNFDKTISQFRAISKESKLLGQSSKESAKEIKTFFKEFESTPRALVQLAVVTDQIKNKLSLGLFKRDELTLAAEAFLKISDQAKEVARSVNDAKEAFEPLSSEAVKRLREIDAESKRLNIEFNIAKDKGQNLLGIQDQIDKLQFERDAIIQGISDAQEAIDMGIDPENEIYKGIKGYDQLIAANDALQNAITNVKKELEDGKISQSDYNREIAFLEDQQSQIAELLDQYADSTGVITANVRELAFELNSVSRELAQAKLEAEKTATAAQVELIQGRLSGDVSATDFARGQTEIATQQLQTIADEIAAKQEEAKAAIEKTLMSDAGLRGQLLTALAGTSMSLDDLIDSGTQQDVEKLREFFTRNGELDGPGGVILQGLEQLIGLRDEALTTGKQLAEQELQAREQIFDLISQEIDLKAAAGDREQQMLEIEQAIRRSTIEAGRALSDFERQLLDIGDAVSIAMLRATNLDEVAKARREEAKNPGLLESDRKKLIFTAEMEEAQAEQLRADAKRQKVEADRIARIREMELAIKQATIANDQSYASTRNFVRMYMELAEGANNYQDAVDWNPQALLNIEQQYIANRVAINKKATDDLMALRAQNAIDEDTYNERIAQLTQERLELQTEELTRMQNLKRKRVEIIDAQIAAQERLNKVTQFYSEALNQQERLLQAQARLQQASSNGAIQNAEQALAVLQKQAQIMEEASKEGGGENSPMLDPQYMAKLKALQEEAGIRGNIQNIEKSIQETQLKIAQEKARILAQEQDTQRKLLALELERNRIAAQTQIKEAEIAAFRAKNAVVKANIDIASATTFEEAIQAQANLLTAQEELKLALAQVDISRQNAVINDRLAQIEKDALVNEQKNAVDAERFNFAQLLFDSKELSAANKNPFQALEDNGFKFTADEEIKKLINIGDSLKGMVDFSAYDKLIEQIDKAREPLQQRIAQEQQAIATTDKLAQGVQTLNQRIEGLINTLGRPNIIINGNASAADAIELMRAANR